MSQLWMHLNFKGGRKSYLGINETQLPIHYDLTGLIIINPNNMKEQNVWQICVFEVYHDYEEKYYNNL